MRTKRTAVKRNLSRWDHLKNYCEYERGTSYLILKTPPQIFEGHKGEKLEFSQSWEGGPTPVNFDTELIVINPAIPKVAATIIAAPPTPSSQWTNAIHYKVAYQLPDKLEPGEYIIELALQEPVTRLFATIGINRSSDSERTTEPNRFYNKAQQIGRLLIKSTP
jgi:hypothetical protein